MSITFWNKAKNVRKKLNFLTILSDVWLILKNPFTQFSFATLFQEIIKDMTFLALLNLNKIPYI